MLAMLFSPNLGTVEGIPRLEGDLCIPQGNESVVSREGLYLMGLSVMPTSAEAWPAGYLCECTWPL